MRASGRSLFKILLAGAALTGLALAWGGCTTAQAVRVQPWERGAMADYTMRSDRDPLADS